MRPGLGLALGASLALASAPVGAEPIRWPAGETWQVTHQVESHTDFHQTHIDGWESVTQRWRFSPRASDGTITAEVIAVAGEKVSVGRAAEGPLHAAARLDGPPPASASMLWWYVWQRAPYTVRLAADGRSALSVILTDGPEAVRAEYLKLGGDPEAPPEGLDAAIEGLSDPARITRQLPTVGPSAEGAPPHWASVRTAPALLNATLLQHRWHARGEGPGGPVDAYVGTGRLQGSVALNWIVAVQSYQLGGHHALRADGRPGEVHEHIEVVGKVATPSRQGGLPTYQPIAFDLMTQTAWAPAP